VASTNCAAAVRFTSNDLDYWKSNCTLQSTLRF